MDPMLGREVVERQQRFTVSDQTLGRLRIFGAVGLQEGVEGAMRRSARLGHPDCLDRTLGFALYRTRQVVQDVHRLMHPTALMPRFGEDLVERRPESQGTVTR